MIQKYRNSGVLKTFWCLILLISLISFISAPEPEMPGAGADEDVMKGVEIVTENVPLDESGQFDPSKLNKTKSLAEARIEGINNWFKDNATWLKYIFGMQPEISWLFALNVYFMLFCLVVFVLNGQTIWIFLHKKSIAQLFGLAFYVIVLMWIPVKISGTTVFLNLAKLILPFVTTWWGIAITILCLIILPFLEKFYVQNMEQRGLEKAKQRLQESSKEAREEAEHIGKIGEALEEGFRG